MNQEQIFQSSNSSTTANNILLSHLISKDRFAKHYSKGKYIYLPSDLANKVYYIKKGRIKIGTYSNSGKEMTKAIVYSGEFFGEMALIGASQCRNYAITTSDTFVYEFTLSEIKTLLKKSGQLNMYFIQKIGNRLLETEKRLESIVFNRSRTRVIEFLMHLCATKGQRVGYEWVVRNFLTHQEIANFIATSRQTVTTVLNDLEWKKILTYNRKRLLIRDLDALEGERGRM